VAYISDWMGRIGERRLIFVILLTGFALRLAAGLHYTHLVPLPVENQLVAASLAQHHGYADAFRPGSGPTAHTGPLAPLPLAAIYALFGAGTPLAQFVSMAITIACVLASIYVLNACFRELGIEAGARLAAVAFTALMPIQLYLESAELAAWEVGYATVALYGILLAALKLDRRESIPLMAWVGLAAAVAVLVLLSPAPGLGAAGILGLLLLRREGWPMRIFVAGLTLAIFVAITTPWMLRNERLLGARIRTRTSFAYSFAVGFHDKQLTDGLREANTSRVIEIAPHHRSGPGYARMKAAGGEVAYTRKLVAETKRWIVNHPLGAAKIALRNLWNYYCPPAWLWDRWSKTPVRPISKIRAFLFALIALAGLVNLFRLLALHQWRFLYPASIAVLPALPYILTYPLLRYRYPVSSLLIFLAAAGAGALWLRYRRRRQADNVPVVCDPNPRQSLAPFSAVLA